MVLVRRTCAVSTVWKSHSWSHSQQVDQSSNICHKPDAVKTLWIDGGWQDSHGSRVRRVENPATLELVDEVFDATADDVRRACAAAAKAQRQWRKVPALERGKLLHETSALMRTYPARLSEL